MSDLFSFTDPCEPYCHICIPLEVTPIYTQLRADQEGRGRYARGGWIRPEDLDRPGITEPHLIYPECAPTPKSRALLKKGRKK